VSHAFAGREWSTERTTPEAPELYRLLAAMRDAEVGIAAMEVSSHALALSRVEGATFAVGAFLNLSQDHLDFHGDMGRYFATKASLIERLPEDATAALSADQQEIAELADRTPAEVVTFGRREGATVQVIEERCAIDGTEVILDAPGGPYTVRTHLAGRFVPDNLAAASACAIGAGLPMDAVIAGALELRTIPGRMERVDAGQPFAVVVDYAHTEEALRRLLSGIREMVEGSVLVVFGCGGDRDRGKRAPMGRAAAENADRLFVTSDNPRSEDPLAIVAQIRSGVESVPGAEERTSIHVDRAEAVHAAIREARAGDAVVVAGKGHETTQTFEDRVETFDDRDVARRALAAAGYCGGCRAGA
jgi:UDP-N-acetylmuramoyl-L-alanyl-D-glutamate--2,6-diaminopimelate ligase